MSFEGFFEAATGFAQPYAYQRRLAESPWPDVLDVPTGLGKTAATVLAWLYKRRILGDVEAPRRLVYCLPMRVLVEQTVVAIGGWLERLGLQGAAGEGGVSLHVLMGGEPDLRSWAEWPEEDMIIVGTQDLLLSRALMRGYGMSRYQWPIHYAWLHNDALWVFDEVQLMGPGLATSAQLEGLRRALGTARACRSLWASATLCAEWLGTVDFRNQARELATMRLDQDDLANEAVARRRDARKRLHRAATVLDSDSARQRARAYVEALADEVREAHVPGTQTLVIVNRVERAQQIYRALGADAPAGTRLLLHARFRPRERRAIESRLRDGAPAAGRIVVATQAVEAGVDISSRTLFTELAPWASMVQRFGRCNRAGEHDEAQIHWIDLADDAGESAPYDATALERARTILQGGLRDASPGDLPSVSDAPPVGLTLRRRDLLDLFDTDPDLAGFDVDVAGYIRDTGAPQCRVFWRNVERAAHPDVPGPSRDELCPVGLGQLREHLGKRARIAWAWDALVGRWARAHPRELRPGAVLLLKADEGGYSPEVGFVRDSTAAVEPVDTGQDDAEAFDAEPRTLIGRFVPLTEHLTDARSEALALTGRLESPEAERAVVCEAAVWHDVGKAHAAFQAAILDFAEDREAAVGELWAKSAASGEARSRGLRFRVDAGWGAGPRPGFRHELASLLAWLAHGEKHAHHDLVAYLIAAHHGKVRLGLRALPIEREPPEPGRAFARGVWEGDVLPSVRLNGRTVPETTLGLDIISLGEGPSGPSWSARTRGLLDELGPFRLAWLEALLRIADARASRREGEPSGKPAP